MTQSEQQWDLEYDEHPCKRSFGLQSYLPHLICEELFLVWTVTLPAGIPLPKPLRIQRSSLGSTELRNIMRTAFGPFHRLLS